MLFFMWTIQSFAQGAGDPAGLPGLWQGRSSCRISPTDEAQGRGPSILHLTGGASPPTPRSPFDPGRQLCHLPAAQAGHYHHLGSFVLRNSRFYSPSTLSLGRFNPLTARALGKTLNRTQNKTPNPKEATTRTDLPLSASIIPLQTHQSMLVIGPTCLVPAPRAFAHAVPTAQ